MIKTDALQFGLSGTQLNNAHWRTDGAGGFILSRGAAGTPISSILSADPSNNVSVGGNLNVSGIIAGTFAARAWDLIYSFVPNGNVGTYIDLPTGYSAFKIILSGIKSDTGGAAADLISRVYQGGAILSGGSDYYQHLVRWEGPTGGNIVSGGASFMAVMTGGQPTIAEPLDAELMLNPGGPGQRGGLLGICRHTGNTGGRVVQVSGHQILTAGARVSRLGLFYTDNLTFSNGYGLISVQGLKS